MANDSSLCWGDRRVDRTLAYGLFVFNLCLQMLSMTSALCSFSLLSINAYLSLCVLDVDYVPSTCLQDHQPNTMGKPFQVIVVVVRLFVCCINPGTSFVCDYIVPESTPLLGRYGIKFFRTGEPNMLCQG